MVKQQYPVSRDNNEIVDTFWSLIEFIVVGLSTSFEVWYNPHTS